MAAVGLGLGAAMTTAFAAASAVIPTHVHSTAFGFLTGASLIGIAVSPPLSGLVAARSIPVVFLAGVALLVALAILVRRLMVVGQMTIEPSPTAEDE
jgi:MFS family permease